MSSIENITGTKGKYEKVSKYDLKVDHDYQREQVDVRTIQNMARNWNWVLCQSLVVARRISGDMYIIDGQQRHAASLLNSSITWLPCIVYPSTGKEWEATAFEGINANRKRLSSFDIFRPRLQYHEKVSTEIYEFVKSKGYSISSSSGINKISFINTLAEKWKVHPEEAKKAINLCIESCDNRYPINNFMFRGIYWLLLNHAEFDEIALRNLRSADISTILINIKRASGLGLGYDKAAALGILKTIDHGRSSGRIGVKIGLYE